MVHHGWTRFWKIVEKEAVAEHLETLRAKVSKQYYLGRCSAWSTQDEATKLADGLSDPVFIKNIDGKQARTFAETEYSKVVEKIRAARAKALKLKEDEAARVAAREKELLAKKPETLLV